MEQILIAYYDNNAKKLRAVVDKILSGFGGLADKDADDFYSLANEVFADAIKRFDASQSFDGFLYSCLSNKIKTEMTRRNREKRKADRMSISMDTPIGEDGSTTIGDMIVDDFDLEREVLGDESDESSKIKQYMDMLSKRQREVASLLAASYGAGEIQQILHITKREYSDAMAGIRSYDNISILF